MTIGGMLLAPGAGAGSDQPALVAIDHDVSVLGIAVVRMDFPYHLAGRRRPDPQPVLEAAVHDHATALASQIGGGTDRLVLGGRSMGGRICSQVVAAGLPAAGLVLVSYPLHPPGTPERLRTAHLPSVQVPCLFVSGTRDAFGTPAEMGAATDVIDAPVTHVWIEGGDHGLRRRDLAVAAAVTKWLDDTFGLGSRRRA